MPRLTSLHSTLKLTEIFFTTLCNIQNYCKRFYETFIKFQDIPGKSLERKFLTNFVLKQEYFTEDWVKMD